MVSTGVTIPSFKPINIPTITTTTPTTITLDPIDGLSDNLEDFTFALGDTVYTLPMPYSTLINDGWEISSYSYSEDTPIKSNKYDYVSFSKGENSITAEIINLSGNTKPIKECKIGGIQVSNYQLQDPSYFRVAKNICLLNSEADIIAAYGSTDNYRDYDDYNIIEYLTSADDYKIKTEFTWYKDKDDNKYNSIELKNFVADESDITETSTEVPEYLSDYKDPKIDTTSGIKNEAYITLDGQTYNLPCPASEFINNGWEIVTDLEGIGSGCSEYVLMQKEESKMECTLTNYADYQTTPSNCAVSKVHVDFYDLKDISSFDFFGIKLGDKETSLQNQIKDSSVDWDLFESIYSNSYSYFSPYDADKDLYFYIIIDNERGKISNISITGDTWYY